MSDDDRILTPGTLSANVQVDDDNDTVTIFGIEYSGELFRGLGFSLRPEVDYFRILNRDGKRITIQRVTPEGVQK